MLLRKVFIGVNLAILAVVISGCGLAGEKHFALGNFRERNRLLFAEKLRVGMSEEKVRSIGAQWDTSVKQFMRPTVYCSNPQRSETRDLNNDSLLILWYYTDLKKNDGLITTDELTPVVLQNGKVIGWGDAFLDDLSSKQR